MPPVDQSAPPAPESGSTHYSAARCGGCGRAAAPAHRCPGWRDARGKPAVGGGGVGVHGEDRSPPGACSIRKPPDFLPSHNLPLRRALARQFALSDRDVQGLFGVLRRIGQMGLTEREVVIGFLAASTGGGAKEGPAACRGSSTS